MADTYLQRFFPKIQYADKKTGCWNWSSTKRAGYGLFKLDGKNVSAHRLSYNLFKGSISPELELDHLCRNRACVNPAHLEPVSHQQNCERGNIGLFSSSKTHCPQGHEYQGENLYVNPNTGRRTCRSCHRENTKLSKRRRYNHKRGALN